MRIHDKIKEIEQYIEELEEISPTDLEQYKTDVKTKAACERYFEKILESAVDLAFLTIKEEKFKIPEDDKAAFDILANEGVITITLSSKMKDAKGMRNIIAHQYGNVDDETVFHAITKELIRDVCEFVEKINIHSTLMSSKNTIPIDEAIERIKKN